MPLTLTVYGQSDPGLVREKNEDAFVVAELTSGRTWPGPGPESWPTEPRGVLLAVSDGLGGEPAGEVASAVSVESLFTAMAGRPQSQEEYDEPRWLKHVVTWANERVKHASQRPGRQGMGATLTAMLVRGNQAWAAQVGDSRAYLIRGGSLRQLTRDQSWVQMMVDAGAMTPEEAENSPRKNVVAQFLGQDQAPKVAVGHIPLQPGDRLLLCSDGLSNVLGDDDIERIGKAGATNESVGALVQSVLAKGAPDNVTIVLAELSLVG